ncbi:MAG: formyltransferase family protein [Clostridia bacterium]|nr:formyltransferase family protein [Clostridia bacterium]
MHVGIITYQTGHLKTWQILKKLMTKSFEITLYAFPFKYKPQSRRMFEERPFQLIPIDMKEFCAINNIRYIEVDGWGEQQAKCLGVPGEKKIPDVFLTCIAKIIPQAFITNRIIINAHPGLLPENRGLDAFKWSIINEWPIGVSLHVIDEYIDRGIILHKIKVPVLSNDTLRSLAERAYEMECDLQANFDYYLHNLESGINVSDRYPLSKKTIPDELDFRLEEIFMEKREKLVSLSK